jgi:glycosyltransferase involved in cell wall biosynthesis
VSPEVVNGYLRRCDVFCLPSFSEGLPVSIMEAMAVGAPVVATAIAGIPELAAHRETALTVPPGNVDALARALVLALSDLDLTDRLVDSARAAIDERHSLRRNVPRLVTLFERSLSAHAVAPVEAAGAEPF